MILSIKQNTMENTLKKLIEEKVIAEYNSIIKSYIGWDRLNSDHESMLFNNGFYLKNDWDEDRGMLYYYSKKRLIFNKL